MKSRGAGQGFEPKSDISFSSVKSANRIATGPKSGRALMTHERKDTTRKRREPGASKVF
jgi:hypothetical protein